MSPIGQVLDEHRTAVSVLLWGREGSGKTTSGLRMTALDPKGKVVLINAEAGAKRQALMLHGVDPKRIEVWPPEDKGPGYITYETIEAEVIKPMEEALAADSKAYIGVVIDSFSELARRFLENVTAAAYADAVRLGKNRSRWFVGLEDHGVAASQMRSILRRFRDLGIHLVITALERRDVDQNTSMVTYGPAMGPAVGNDTMGLVDLVGFCQVEKLGGEDFWTATFLPTQTRRAKDRYGLMPATMVSPYFDRIAGYIEGEITRENDPERQRLLDTLASADGNTETPPAETGKTTADEAPTEPAADDADTTTEGN